MKILLTITLMAMVVSCFTQNRIEKNGMTVQWYYESNTIVFELSSPKQGWVAIGFNEENTLKGAHLIMARVSSNNIVDVTEHYTIKPGTYKPFIDLGETSQAKVISGSENDKGTTVKFQLPILPPHKLAKDLSQGKSYNLTMAYSLDDDYQHHSIMRTSVKIEL